MADKDELNDKDKSQEEQPDLLNMSDEDIMNMEPPKDEVDIDPDDTSNIQDTEEEIAKQKEIDAAKEKEEAEAATKKKEDKETAEAAAKKEQEEKDKSSDLGKADDDVDDPEAAAKKAADEAKNKEKDKDDKGEKKETPKGELDKSVEFDKILQPFKANGTEMQVKNADEAITLMQMGANYHKKMAGLKPVLKNVRLLEDHGLMDGEKISFLIDLHSKKPEAIAKLVKDSGIDPVTMDVEKDNDYVPETRTVSDTDMALDDVIDSIKGSGHYKETLNVVTEKWDDASLDAIAGQPDIISVINRQMEDGTYKVVADAVERERAFGRLVGVSDLEAYKQMGDILHKEYKLPGQVNPDATTATDDNTNTKPVDDAANAKKEAEEKAEAERIAKKKAASPSAQASSDSDDKKTLDPLALSDEDIMKMDESDFVIAK